MVERLFDLLDLYQGEKQLNVALAGKVAGEWVSYSSSEYKQLATDFSYGLLQMGYRPGDRIAIVTNSCPEWNMVDMGMMQVGVVGVPIYSTISHDEYIHILKHAAPRMLLISDKILYNRLKPIIDEVQIEHVFTFNVIPGARNWMEIVNLGTNAHEDIRTQFVEIKNAIKPEDMCTIIYTSGTTGVPKGVMLSHRNIVTNAIATANCSNVKYGSKALSFLPLSHIYERMMNYHFQYNGVSIYYVENMGTILPNMKEIQPHVFNSVPRILERIFLGLISKEKDLSFFKRHLFQAAVNFGKQYDPEAKYNIFERWEYNFFKKYMYPKWKAALSPNLSMIISGGAPLNENISRLFTAMGIDVMEGYGLTETSPVISVGDANTRKMRVCTVGQPLKGLEVKLSEDGEILCKGPNVMMGYYKEPELTAEIIDADGFFHTGDIGSFDKDHFLKITDRKKELFKLSNGKYVAPQVLENKLCASYFIDHAMVFGETQKFASVIISPNFAYLHEWCAKNNIVFDSNEDLICQTEVLARFQREINEVNKSLSRTEQIKRFRLVTDEWSTQSGELSQTLKLKRKYLCEKYQQIIEQIYAKK